MCFLRYIPNIYYSCFSVGVLVLVLAIVPIAIVCDIVYTKRARPQAATPRTRLLGTQNMWVQYESHSCVFLCRRCCTHSILLWCAPFCAAHIKPLVLPNPALPDQDLVIRMRHNRGTFTVYAINTAIHWIQRWYPNGIWRQSQVC